MENKLFSVGSPADDMLDWANKLIALGGLISSAATSKIDDALMIYGETGGFIVSQYAEALMGRLKEAYPALNSFYRAKKEEEAVCEKREGNT